MFFEAIADFRRVFEIDDTPLRYFATPLIAFRVSASCHAAELPSAPLRRRFGYRRDTPPRRHFARFRQSARGRGCRHLPPLMQDFGC